MGGKYELVPYINPILEYAARKYNLDEYCETFGGGMRNLLNLDHSLFNKIIYCELDYTITALFYVLRDESLTKELIHLLERWDHKSSVFDYALEHRRQINQLALQGRQFTHNELINIARSAFFVIRSSHSANLKTYNKTDREAYYEQVKKLGEVAPFLKNVKLYWIDGMKMIADNSNNPKRLIYCDPPYDEKVMKTKGQYEDRSWDEKKQIEFARMIHDTKNKAVISGYDTEAYNHLLKGWRKLALKNIFIKSSGKEDQRQMEYIYYNFSLPNEAIPSGHIEQIL